MICLRMRRNVLRVCLTPVIFLSSLLFCCAAVRGSHGAEQRELLTLMMPEVGPEGVRHNDYMCRSVQLQPMDSYIVQFEPRADPRVAHHMLLFGCSTQPNPRQSWSCKSTNRICSWPDKPEILFAWALNASGIHLPDGVGLEIGPTRKINYVVVQVHYGHPEAVPPEAVMGEHEALVLHLTQKKQPFIAGVYILGSSSTITAGKEAAYVDTACIFGGPNPIHPIAFRTHAHSLGKVIAGYVVKNNDEDWELIGSRSPQDAQAFYPAVNFVTVEPGDWLAARCVFNTQAKTHSVHMGANSEDEMCNFYIMYYMANNGQSLLYDSCWNTAPSTFQFPELHVPEPVPGNGTETEAHHSHSHEHDGGNGGETSVDRILSSIHDIVDELEGESPSMEPTLPALFTKPPPQSPTQAERPSDWPFFEGGNGLEPDQTGSMELGQEPTLELAEDWSLNGVSSPNVGGITLGQVTAVAVDRAGFVHVFHRGPTKWDFSSFSQDNHFRHVGNGPINVPTLLKFSSSGELLSKWGQDLFYMPHGLTVDHLGNFWITDVAMHQVFKFSSEGDTAPSMSLGKRFQPGSTPGFFCQPAGVAVEDSGVFYVADGYCNSRILKFDSNGYLLQEWNQIVDGLFLHIPHSMTFSKAQNKLFVADRENGRILSYNTLSASGQPEVFAKELTGSRHWGSLYAISFNGSGSWPLYAIGGPMKEDGSYWGHTMSQGGERSVAWRPSTGFSLPHDLAVDSVSGAIYVAEIGPNRIWKFIPISHPVHTVEDPGVLLTTTQPTVSASSLATRRVETSQPTTTTHHLPHITQPVDSSTTTGRPHTTQPVDSTTGRPDATQPVDSSTTATAMPEGTHSQVEAADTHTTVATAATENQSPSVATTSPPSTITTITTESPSHTVSMTTPTAAASQPGTPFSQQNPNAEQNQDQDETLPQEHKNSTTDISSTHNSNPSHPHANKAPVYQYGIIAAIIVVTIVIILLIIGILKEHRACRWYVLSLCNRRRNSYKQVSNGMMSRQPHPRDALHSLLGPSKQRFSRVQNFDSDSEVDEFPIFSRV